MLKLVMVICVCFFPQGTPGAGHTDKLGRLKDLCDQYSMWLHVEGWVMFSKQFSYFHI